MSDAANLHSGHRDRVRERFCAEGLDSFADHNVLEFLLFYSIPRKDTNELAHRLILHFGSLCGVFDASIERLMEVKGISYSTAVLIKLAVAVGRRYEIMKHDVGTVLDSTDIAADYIAPFFMGESEEIVYAICLDGKNKVIATEKISKGSITTSEVSVRSIVDCVVKHKAVKVILSHNHPASKARPSYEDIQTTKKIRNVLTELAVCLEDHIIIGNDGKTASMRELGILSE